MNTFKIKEDLYLSEQVLKQWDEIFIPRYDFFYFEDPLMALKDLPKEVLIYSRDELSDDMKLSNLNVRTAFTPWNVDKKAKYVAVVPNEHFAGWNEDQKKNIFYEQWRLGRGQVWKYSWILSILDDVSVEDRNEAVKLLYQNKFETPEGEMVANQSIIWVQLPEEVRKTILIHIAILYSDDSSVWTELPEVEKQRLSCCHPGIVKYFNTFASENGPNCFATALAGATTDSSAVDWVISQWIQPQETLMFSLTQRGYHFTSEYKNSLPNQTKVGDILVWVNEDKVP